MATVYLGLGSNKAPDYHISWALKALTKHFGDVACSPIYRSVAVGFDGDDFLNAVTCIQTDREVGEIKELMTVLEDQCGRDRSQPKFSDRVLDIDILLYDDKVGTFDGLSLPRDEITQYAHVLKPLADLAPTLCHPGTHQTYQMLWDTFTGDRAIYEHTLVSERPLP